MNPYVETALRQLPDHRRLVRRKPCTGVDGASQKKTLSSSALAWPSANLSTPTLLRSRRQLRRNHSALQRVNLSGLLNVKWGKNVTIDLLMHTHVTTSLSNLIVTCKHRTDISASFVQTASLSYLKSNLTSMHQF